MLKVYLYKNCDACRKAGKWLRENGVEFESIPIRETPPTADELRFAAAELGLQKLFNTSGKDYRELGLKDQVKAMSLDEAVVLLGGNGNLVKRPFVVDSSAGIALTGFKEEVWAERLLNG